MEKVYDMLKTMTIRQLHDCVTEAVMAGWPKAERDLFIHQVKFAIQKKESGEWA